jgi:hypothetical protein
MNRTLIAPAPGRIPSVLGASVLVFLFALASCATLPYQNQPPRAAGDPLVMGSDEVGLDQFLSFAQPKNPAYGRQGWTQIWQAYRDACRTEGVSQAVALVQMVHETNWLKFGGTVQASQNNFAGLGVTGGGVAGLSFPDIRTGALAHVQHLKAYGSTEPLAVPAVDPRFRYVKRGTAPTVQSLTKRWAADPNYGDKLIRLYRQLEGLG